MGADPLLAIDLSGLLRIWTPFLVVVFTSAVIGYGADWIIVRTLRLIAKRGNAKLHELIIPAIRPAFGVILFAAGIWYGSQWLGLDVEGPVLGSARRVSFAIAVLFGALVFARLLTGLLRYAAEKREKFHHAGYLGSRLGGLLVWTFAIFSIFQYYNVAVTPLLTGLGLAALAIGLSLQDTLRNLFAGIWIQTGHPLQVGHYVRIQQNNPANNLEGFVIDIGWRTTEIRTITHDVAVMPNAELAQSTVVDFHLPDPTTALLIPISVGYETDIDQFERVMLEEANAAVGQVPGVVKEPKPALRFAPGFGAWSLDFTLWIYIRNYFDHFLAESEIRKRIWKRLRAEGIRVPYPMREQVQIRDRPDVAPLGSRDGNGGGPAATVAPQR